LKIIPNFKKERKTGRVLTKITKEEKNTKKKRRKEDKEET
jgi:hypothetical protein